MVVLVDEDELFSLFGISSIEELEEIKYLISPSVYEYHLKNIVSCGEEVYINKTMVEFSVYLFDNYAIYKDYDSMYYIEILNSCDLEEGSLF